MSPDANAVCSSCIEASSIMYVFEAAIDCATAIGIENIVNNTQRYERKVIFTNVCLVTIADLQNPPMNHAIKRSTRINEET